jgi:two-component system OmpR family sensor kinase
MRLRPKSVRAQLTLWYALVLSVPLIAFAVVSYGIFSRTLRSRTDAFIGDALTVFSRELVSERRIRPTIPDAIRATVAEVRFRHLDIIVVDDSGAAIAMSGQQDNALAPPRLEPADSVIVLAAITAELGNEEWTSTLRRPDGPYRILVRSLAVGDRRQFRLAGVYPLVEVETTLERIRQLFMIAIPLLIAAAATGGSFLAKRSLSPVTAMASRAAEIGASNLHERLPVVADDELGALARVLNDLLNRLESSFDQQRRFMADASHELRTPATILRTEADVTLSRPARTETEYRESMTVVQNAAQRLTRIVDDIFLLARADAGHLVMHVEPLHLEDLTHDMVRAVRPIADHYGVRVELGDAVEAPMQGDPDLLGRVILNLLDNAIKHSSKGGTVELAMAAPGAQYEITVTDAGSGIPADAHDRVFERFFRADSARSRAESSVTSGSGLGLAIGRRIAELHGGRLDLVSSRPGHTAFRLTLPRKLPNRNVFDS